MREEILTSTRMHSSLSALEYNAAGPSLTVNVLRQTFCRPALRKNAMGL